MSGDVDDLPQTPASGRDPVRPPPLPPPSAVPPEAWLSPLASPRSVIPAEPLTTVEAATLRPGESADPLQMLASVATETVRLPVRRQQASLLLRIGAFGLDVVFVALMMLVVICIMAIFVRGLDWFDDRQILLILLVLYPIYSLAEVLGPAAVGKVIFGIHITGVDGAPSDRTSRLLRWPLRNLPLAVLGAGLAVAAIGFGSHDSLTGLPAQTWRTLAAITAGTLIAVDLLPALAPGGRSLHERLSGTAVYHDIGGSVRFTRVELTAEEMGVVESDAAADLSIDEARTGDSPLALSEADPESEPDEGIVSDVDSSAETSGPEQGFSAGDSISEQDLAELALARAVAASRTIRPAPFVIRLIATVLDFTLLILISGTVVPALAIIAVTIFPSAGPVLLLVPLVVLTAYVGCEVWASASPGKFLTGLRITAVDARPSGFGQRMLRAGLKNVPLIAVLCLGTIATLLSVSQRAAISPNVAAAMIETLKWVTMAGLLFYLVSCLFALRPSRRSLHDLICDTAVYEEVELSAARVRGDASPTPFEVRVLKPN